MERKIRFQSITNKNPRNPPRHPAPQINERRGPGDRMIEPLNSIVIYQPDDGLPGVEVCLRDETVWLSQAQMAVLFDKDSDTIGLRLKNIYQSGELIESATTEKSSVVRQEGGRQVKRNIKVYNLDAIISVGYRVNSKKGTQFRIWGSQVLK